MLISVKILLQKDINIYHGDYKKVKTDMSSASHLLFPFDEGLTQKMSAGGRLDPLSKLIV